MPTGRDRDLRLVLLLDEKYCHSKRSIEKLVLLELLYITVLLTLHLHSEINSMYEMKM